MSQEHQILRYLQRGHAITPLEALRMFGCFRLGARIWDLRRAGHKIIKTTAEDGRKRWARYKLMRSAHG